MRNSNEKIIDSIIVIKETCEDMEGRCDLCPLGDDSGCCMINQGLNPDNWKINESGKVWRALF